MFLIVFAFLQAVPHSRRETKDTYNDETFGPTDSTSEDKVEEEKKRRGVSNLHYRHLIGHLLDIILQFYSIYI